MLVSTNALSNKQSRCALTGWTSKRRWCPALESCRPRDRGRRYPSWPRSTRTPPPLLSVPLAGCRRIWRGRQVHPCTSESTPGGSNREKAGKHHQPSHKAVVRCQRRYEMWWSQVAAFHSSTKVSESSSFLLDGRPPTAASSKTHLLAGGGKSRKTDSTGSA